MNQCRECMSEMPAGAVRCGSCGKRQTVDPAIYALILVIALAVFVAWMFLSV